jgi:hypothetical protein
MLRMVLASQAASLRQIAFDAPTVRLDANLPALPQLKGLTSVMLYRVLVAQVLLHSDAVTCTHSCQCMKA